ncbi:PPE family protein [Mycobacterium alsense]|uniref:PPE domain-containing protein n=1 Tax=Mycobacterium alsense TaxID=324058 RepID=A0AA42BXA3_9MYCO|nr:PPE family protein [Mycobacterium alsense]MCV7377303.1 PPE domain-containing protein [Mycobacterium alsense]OQZ90219.1 PPE family protein [Mycobacterium alsense]
MDFALFPPEFNSGRMYAGAGSGPMVAAASAWDGLAAELNFATSAYRSALVELTGGPWVGPSSTVMTAAMTPYLSWMTATAAQAEQTATQLKSAVAAYEAAFMATVPPPEIEVNRALLAALVATNILGQNTPAIAATEAQYAEMWAQDAAAMYGYAGASAAATKLTAFTTPPQTTDPGGTAAQAAAVTEAANAAAGPGVQSGLTQAMDLVPGALQTLGTGGAFDPFSFVEEVLGTTTGQALNVFTTDVGNWALTISGPLFTASGITPLLGGLYGLALPAAAATAADVAPDAGLGALVSSAGPGTGGSVAASVGGADSIGKLSVPQSWTSGPGIRLASSASPLATAGLGAVPQAEAPGGFVGGIPPVGSLVNAPRGEQTRARSGTGQKVIPTMPGEDGAEGMPLAPAAQPQRTVRHVASALSDGERQELDKLRKEIAEAAMERDAAARLIKEAML